MGGVVLDDTKTSFSKTFLLDNFGPEVMTVLVCFLDIDSRM